MRRTSSLMGDEEPTTSFIRPGSIVDANPDDVKEEMMQMGQAIIQEDNSGFFRKDSEVNRF